MLWFIPGQRAFLILCGGRGVDRDCVGFEYHLWTPRGVSSQAVQGCALAPVPLLRDEEAASGGPPAAGTPGLLVNAPLQ
jgi:hypothetical protein